MPDLPYMKFWFSDYIDDAGHLTLAEHGVYLKLLWLAWKSPRCSLPLDKNWLCRKLTISDQEYDDIAVPIINEFWTEEDHRIYQKRQREEFFSAQATSEMRKMAADKRWKGRKIIPLKSKD